ncbi:hypothetical protein FRB96_009412 [Tulasnella sp. 330]|nr:hypothetical protein FRB96_009412 [Tulasnella sp. 330]KAG8884727.1 hypothetical protein FRB97_003511 [Tulasnella sp. 331]KAG8889702.1 hypothetical protein FRB98_003265 [Tulasnella sp. 332]
MKSPLPQPLPQECIKAAKIFRSFVNGADSKVIPRSVLQGARGFAIFTVVKAGFFFSARAGSGVVIARLPDGSFSAPSAIGTAGVGFGGQAGAEVTDFLIVLNSQSAVKSFMSAGSLSLGGNLSLAVGPLGRTGEVSGSLNTKGKVAAMYSYSKTKGLFGGLSLEGSVIVERQDANAIAYDADVSAKQLLSGSINPPYWAEVLIDMLQSGIGDTTPGWKPPRPEAGIDRGMSPASDAYDAYGANESQSTGSRDYEFTGIGSSRPSLDRKDSAKGTKKSSFTGSILPSKLRRKSSAAGQGDRIASPFEESTFTYDSPTAVERPYSPGSSRGPVRVPFDGFAEGIDDDPWGERLRPTMQQTRSSSKPLSPPPATTAQFPKYFESDFDSTRDSPFSSKNAVTTRPRSATTTAVGGDPFPDLTTSMNAWSLSPTDDITRQMQSGPDRTRSTSPFYRGKKSAHAWADKPMYNSSNSRTSSSRSNSPPTPPSSAASHPPVTSKPVRSLSVRPGADRPAPSGALKAIALYDYNANEAGDLSFTEGDVIWVTEKTQTTNDWWTGVLAANPDTKGIFPANFVILDD